MDCIAIIKGVMKLLISVLVFVSFNSAFAMDPQQRMLVAAGGAGIVASGYYGANTIASYAQEGYTRSDAGKPHLLKQALMAGLVRTSTSVGGVTLLNYAIYGKTLSHNLQTYASLTSLILSGTSIEMALAHYWLNDEHSKSNTKKFLIAGGTLALLGAVGIYKNK